MSTKKTVIAAVAILCLGFAGTAVINANTQGGQAQGVKVQQSFFVHQNKYAGAATDLHFKVWQKEDNVNINGWSIGVSGFPNSTSQRGNQPPAFQADGDNGQHAVDVTADGANIPFCTFVRIDITLWLTKFNTIRIWGLNWTQGADAKKAVPHFAWTIDDPVPHPTLTGVYQHTLTITNDDPCDILNLSDIRVLPSASDINIIDTNVPFDTDPNTIQATPQSLSPSQSCVVNVNTTGRYTGNYIYTAFTINDSNVTSVAKHPVTPSFLNGPTVSEWGLIGVGLILLTVGVVVIARRKRLVT